MHRIALFLLALSAFAEPPAENRLEWFRRDKFGMFIHWGPYSHLAGRWEACQVPAGEQAEWIMERCHIPAVRYRELARNFDPVKFDAGAWTALARRAGMKYLVITAKHHDGFAMYRSAASRYNIVDWTPFGRDPVKELAASCRVQGLRFGVYYSHREDWDDPDAYGNDWDYKPAQKMFDRYLERKSKPQVRELLTGYGPLALIWFDRGLYTPVQANEFLGLVRSLQPQCLVNGRVGSYDQELAGDYQSLDDNGMPPGGLDEYWETPQTLNETWGYNEFDHRWKTPGEVVQRLAEIVSKGGNYLLNIGPKGDGTIPQQTVDVLETVGKWIDRNGDSIYGTSPCPLAQIPWGYCTAKDERLYLHVFHWPQDGSLRVHGLRNEIIGAHLLTAPAERLETQKSGGTWVVRVPPRAPDALDSVVVLDLKGSPQVDPPVVRPGAGGDLTLDYVNAITGGGAAKRYTPGGGYHIASWACPKDSASWTIRIRIPGRYSLRITYASRPEWKGGAFEAIVGSETLHGAVRPTGDPYKYETFQLGKVAFPRAGRYTVRIRPTAGLDHPLMHFRTLSLVPENRPRT